MEKIYYDEVLNHEAIDKGLNKNLIMVSIGLIIIMLCISVGGDTSYRIKVFVCTIVGSLILLTIRYSEKLRIKELVTFYNKSIENNKCIEVDDDLKAGFIGTSKNIIQHELRIIWRPGFIYDDETKVYKVENTNVIIVNGYFEDENINRGVKRNYIMVFVGNKYYMTCIDNLICWKKGVYWSIFYKENQLDYSKVNYTRW